MPHTPRPLLVLFIAASATTAILGTQTVSAQGTHLWTQSRIEEFEKGTPQGVAIHSNGQLREGPGLTDLATTPSTFIWSVAVDKTGTPYLGTGSPATVLRGSAQKDGKPVTIFETRDVSVQVVRVGPDGSIYAATVPGGKVYKLSPNSTAKQDESTARLVFDAAKTETAPAGENDPKPNRESKSHYIWDMTFDSSGRLYIAVGGPGTIYRLNPATTDAKPELFFKTDEQHIRALAWDAKGNLIAGSDGSGLVYRISPQGKGYVLFEAPRREITSVSVGSDGTIYAASVGDKSHNPLPPLPVSGVGTITFTIVQPGSLQAANASTSTPEGTEIYALSEDQAPRKIWSSKDDIVYALDAQPDGVLAISGNRGRIFRIQKNGDYADIAHVEAQQGLSITNTLGDAVLIGTGNTGKLYSLGKTQTHEYASDVLDATAYARFGRVEIEPGSANYELLTRTGNVEQPIRGRGDWGWSEWQPLKDGAIQSPPGRFLQWKAILRDGGQLGELGINYLPVNAAPTVDDFVVATGARLNPQPTNPNQQSVNISFPSTNQPAVVPVDTASANTHGPPRRPRPPAGQRGEPRRPRRALARRPPRRRRGPARRLRARLGRGRGRRRRRPGGELLRGLHGFAGEIGHARWTATTPPAPAAPGAVWNRSPGRTRSCGPPACPNPSAPGRAGMTDPPLPSSTPPRRGDEATPGSAATRRDGPRQGARRGAQPARRRHRRARRRVRATRALAHPAGDGGARRAGSPRRAGVPSAWSPAGSGRTPRCAARPPPSSAGSSPLRPGTSAGHESC